MLCLIFSGIDSLRQVIYQTAMTMPNAHNPSQKLIGQPIPRSYIALDKLLMNELMKQESTHNAPFLTEDQFQAVVGNIPDNDITTVDELLGELINLKR